MRASVAVVVGAAALGFTFAGPAQAATCVHVTISPGPTLSPKSVTIDYGGCVSYTNSTPLQVKLTIAKFAAVVNPNAVEVIVERQSGTFPVTAQEEVQGQGIGGTATGTLVVRAKPAPKPSSSPSASTHPSSHPSTAPSSAPPSATPTSSGPVVASSTPGSPPPTVPSQTPAPNQSGQGNPPVIVGIPPTTTPSESPALVPRAQLQPPSGRATGLPAAIAALLIIGAAAAFVRVLLAEPAPGAHERRFVPSPS